MDTTAPVDDEPVKQEPSREQKIDYIMSRPSNYNTRSWLLSLMNDNEIEGLYQFYKDRYRD